MPLAREVSPLVLRLWPAVCELAVRIEQRGSVGHADLCAALGLSEVQARHSFELASPRSGMRSVPSPLRNRTVVVTTRSDRSRLGSPCRFASGDYHCVHG